MIALLHCCALASPLGLVISIKAKCNCPSLRTEPLPSPLYSCLLPPTSRTQHQPIVHTSHLQAYSLHCIRCFHHYHRQNHTSRKKMAFNNPPQLHSNLPDIANHPAFKDSDQIDPAPPRKKSAEVTEDSVHDTGAQAQPPPVPPKSKRRTPEEWSRFARTRVPLTLEHAQSGDKVICCCLSDGAIGAVHYTTYGAILDELEKGW